MLEVKAPATIHLAIAIDQNYVVPFYVLLTSLFLNNRQHNFTIHSIMTGVSEAEKAEMSSFVARNNAALLFYEVDKALVQGLPLVAHYPAFTTAVYYRLFFPQLVPEKITRLLYLDCDIIITGDIAELYHMELNSAPVAAAEDTAMELRTDLGIFHKNEYFNSGVMLLNIDAWNRQNITKKAIRFLKDNPEKILYVDQDALNVVLHQNWRRIDRKFNLMAADIPKDVSGKKLNQLLSRTAIIHFNHIKPWSGLCKNRIRRIYHYYLSRSPKAGAQKKYTDFSLRPGYLYSFLKIRLVETYLIIPLLPTIWRKLKGKN